MLVLNVRNVKSERSDHFGAKTRHDRAAGRGEADLIVDQATRPVSAAVARGLFGRFAITYD